MSGLRWLIDQYFQLPRWERIGNIILISIILVSLGIINFWPEKHMTLAETKQLDKMEAELQKQKLAYEINYTNKYKNNYSNYNYQKSKKNNSSFIFINDLSKASPSQLQKAGLSKKVAFNVFNYLKKGGKIKTEKDILKIYGMTSEMASKFLKNVWLDTVEVKNPNQVVIVKNENQQIDLNQADSSLLVYVRGISPKMAPYIIKFRNSIGAFHSVDQLNEVFKNPLNNFEEIKKQLAIVDFKPFIKINSISAVDLKKHRYFSASNLASTLIAYRDKHGKFTKTEDLKKCVLVTDEILLKITPYLTFE